MAEKKGLSDDISNQATAESDEEDVPGENRETILDQNKATVEDESSPSEPKSPLSRAPTVEETATNNQFSDASDRKQVTVENNVIVEERPIKNTGTVEDEGGDGDSRIRASETVEEHVPTKGDNLFDIHYPRSRAETLRKTKVVFKVNHIKEDKSNKDSPIKGLPTIPLTKTLTDKVLFGRGEGVDVYLHDMLASRYHMELSVDGSSFRVAITNVSQKKTIRINGTRTIEYNNKYTVSNNDHITLGAVTFLIEIAPGEQGSFEYELTFINLLNAIDARPPVPNGVPQSFYPPRQPEFVPPLSDRVNPQPYPYPLSAAAANPYDPYSQTVLPRAYVQPHEYPSMQHPRYGPSYPPMHPPPMHPGVNPVGIPYVPPTSRYNSHEYQLHDHMHNLHLHSNGYRYPVEACDSYGPVHRLPTHPQPIENDDISSSGRRPFQSSQTVKDDYGPKDNFF